MVEEIKRKKEQKKLKKSRDDRTKDSDYRRQSKYRDQSRGDRDNYDSSNRSYRDHDKRERREYCERRDYKPSQDQRPAAKPKLSVEELQAKLAQMDENKRLVDQERQNRIEELDTQLKANDGQNKGQFLQDFNKKAMESNTLSSRLQGRKNQNDLKSVQ